METDIIQSSIRKVLIRIALLILFYIFLIACGIYLLICAVNATKWLLTAPFIGIIAIIFLWGTVGLFALYLIKPLFSFRNTDNSDMVEIKRHDAPELFDMVDELSKEIGCQHPKHIYLTNEVNAAATLGCSIWNLFASSSKNLIIGVGILKSINTEEFRAILGHEFGHFAQGNDKLTNITYSINTILNNLVWRKDFYDRMLNAMINSNILFPILWGKLLYVLTNIARQQIYRQIRFINKANYKLARVYELQADQVSCNIVGKETMISSLCKIEVEGLFQNSYERFLVSCCKTGKRIDNYWEGYDILKSFLAEDYSYTFDYSDTLPTCVTEESFPSRIAFENAWDTHPQLSRRIDNLHKCKTNSEKKENRPAWNLIPNRFIERISQQQADRLQEMTEQKLTVISNDEFKEWLQDEIKTLYYSPKVHPFAMHNIIPFDTSTEKDEEENVACPFTDENRDVCKEYLQALNDLSTINAIKGKSIESVTNKFIYNGRLYKRSKLPVQEHLDYINSLQAKVKEIDRNIFLFILQNCEDTEIKQNVKSAYNCLFHSSMIIDEFNDFLTKKMNLIESFYSRRVITENKNQLFLCECNDLLFKIQRFSKEYMSWDLLKAYSDEDTYNQLLDFKDSTFLSSYHTYDKVDYFFQTADLFYSIYSSVYNDNQFRITQTIKQLAEKETDDSHKTDISNA